MQLANPVPGVDPGPDYANNLSNSLDIVDRHNHSPGNGVLINPNGISINADLPFGINNATLLRSARFSPQSAPLAAGTDIGCLYVSGVDLYYNDVNGNQIKITDSGTVNATSSGIVSGTASAAFAGGVLVVKSTSTSGANVLLQSVELTNSGNLTNILTLQAPTLSGSSSLTLPVVPVATSFMQLDPSGNMSASIPVVQGIQKTMLAPLGEQISSQIASFTTSSTSFVDITDATVTITTTGRPVVVGFQSSGNLSFGGASYGISGTSGTIGVGAITFNEGVTVLSAYLFANLIGTGFPAALQSIITGLPAGAHTLKAQARVATGTAFNMNVAEFFAYEL